MMCPHIFEPSASCISTPGITTTTTITCAHPDNFTGHAILPLLDEEQTQPQEMECYQENDLLLQTLASHLDLLTAGSLFLLPSILPYLASALTAYASSSSSSKALLSNETLLGILALSCVGVMTPLSVFKVLSILETHNFQTPFLRWRHNKTTAIRREAQHEHGSGRLLSQRSPESVSVSECACHRRAAARAVDNHTPKTSRIMLCPTIRTIKKALQRLRGYPSGYGPLVLDTSMSLTEASWTYFSLGQEQPHGHDQDQNQEKQGPCTCLERALSSNASVQPRPRTILLASLGMWTVLIALSSLLGFNTIGTSPVIVSRTPPQNNRSDGLARIVLEHGPSNIDLQSWASTSWDKEPNHCSQKNVRQGESVVTDNVKDEDEDKEDVDDFLDPDSLDAMTMDPEDFVVFRNFLVALEAENLIAKPKDEKQHQDILKATNDLMIDSMLEQDLPCGYRTSPLFTPTWFVGFPAVVQKFRNSINSDHLTTVPHTSGRVFEYLAGWTEVMILAVTMTLGSLLVGLMQSKTLYYQLLEQHELHQQQLFVFETPVRRRSSWTTLALCFALSGSALCLMIDMILAECWDVPSVYFVGIGIAGMILVHAWVPNLPLQVSESMESTDSDDGEEDGEGDEEKGKWGTSMSEHRNACSLDEDRRYGV